MRQRDPSVAIICAIILLLILCLNAHAGDGARALLRQPAPVYPELAHQMHLAGVVMLLLSIDPDGKVTEVQVQSGHPLLVSSAIAAVKQWKYAPATLATQATVCVKFEAR